MWTVMHNKRKTIHTTNSVHVHTTLAAFLSMLKYYQTFEI